MTIALADPAHRIPVGHPPGPVILSPGRWVWWSGRVAIGIKYLRPSRPYITARDERDAQVIQDLCIQGGSFV